MLDKNGREIKSGDVVKISNAYFKNDNGYWLVENSPGDPGWCGKDHCLKKISKKGKISVAKYSTCFWPIMICISDRFKAAEAREWNREHAEIEVVDDIDRTEVAERFKEMAENLEIAVEMAARDFGEESEWVQKYKRCQKHYLNISDSILKAV